MKFKKNKKIKELVNNLKLIIIDRELSINNRLYVKKLIKYILKQNINNKNEMICINEYGNVNLLDIFINKKLSLDTGKYSDVYFFSLPIKKLLYKKHISIKIIPLDSNDYMNMYNTKYNVWRELKSMYMMSKLITKRICPNFSMIYSHYICNSCVYKNKHLKDNKNKMCLLILNEISQYNLKRWIIKKSKENINENKLIKIWYNILFQIIVSIFCIQKKYQMIHRDLHWGNILVDEIKPGGYWIYNIEGIKYYIPNIGILIKIWDFGKSNSITFFSQTSRDESFLKKSESNTIYHYKTDINKIINIDNWIKNSTDINNKNFIPLEISRLLRIIKESNNKIPYAIIINNMTRYLNNKIGQRILKNDLKYIYKIKNPDLLSKGEIICYNKKYAIVESIYDFKIKLITEKNTFVYLKIIDYKNIFKFNNTIHNNIDGEFLGIYNI